MIDVKNSSFDIVSAMNKTELDNAINKDDLQSVIQLMRKSNFDIELQFVNYR